MSVILTSEELEQLINNNVDYFKTALLEYSKSKEEHIRKKAMLISYWIKNYTDMINTEKHFEASRLPKYPRGTVLSVDFGFRIGNELGGRHFAVVVDNHNDIKSNIITVLPMTSKKSNTRISRFTYQLEFDLINLYQEKFDKLTNLHHSKLQQISTGIENVLVRENADLSGKSELDRLLSESHKVFQAIKNLETIKAEMSKLKSGSIVNLSQIVTISKQRILNPKQSKDALSGIRLKPNDLDNINKKLEKLFLFQSGNNS